MTPYQILYWHTIPVQVRAGGRHNRVSKELPARFQEAVDNAAMGAGLTGTDAYLEGFTWGDVQAREGTPEAVATTVVAELDAQFAVLDWKGIAAALKSRSS